MISFLAGRSVHNPEDSDLFNSLERASLAYADAITISNQTVTEGLMKTLKQDFSADEIIELTALIAFQNISSKFNSALDVPAEGFCKVQHRIEFHDH